MPSHVAVIVVNAEVHPQLGFSLSAAAPSIATMLNAVSSTQIYSYSFETLELMRDSLENWARELPPDAKKRPVQVYIPELTFESITNDEERNFFNDVPTSFSLPGETVDRLIEEGRKLLRESPDFQRLKANLQGPGGPGSR